MERYDIWHEYNGIRFFLKAYTPNLEECRILILKVIEQTIRDYIGLFDQDGDGRRDLWETARKFIFDDSYLIMWGDKVVTPEELLQEVDLTIEYLRRSVKEQFGKQHGKNQEN